MANYEERPLIGYIPNVLKSVREYQALTHAEQIEVLELFAGIQDALNNQFVETSTEYGVRRWEKILEIVPNPAVETLNFRKNRILLRLQMLLPFTEKWLHQKINELFAAGNVVFSVDYDNYKINTTLNQADMNLLNEVKSLFKKVIPANMEWAFEIIAMLLESTLFVGLNINTRTVTRTVFDLIPGAYPLRTTTNVGILSAITKQIKFEME